MGGELTAHRHTLSGHAGLASFGERVANFAGKRLSHFCDTTVTTYPQVPSRYVWMVNNWKEVSIRASPGGYEMVVHIGIAEPVRSRRTANGKLLPELGR